MADYKGNTCPVCNDKFKEGDDVVVCPDCGTPYHRACWQKVGACVHAAEHAAGFEWKPDAAPEDNENVCANCGTHNPPTAQNCTHCGVPLMPAGKEAAEDTRPIYRRDSAPGTTPGAHPSMSAFSADDSGVYRREVGPEDPIDGIKAKDWASYIGNSSVYYLMQFFRLSETKRKVAISFSALFFGPAYFFYRKMWKEGAIFTALEMLISVPYILTLFVASEAPLVAGMPIGWLLPAWNVCTVLSWGLMVVRALFAVYWYKRECTARIQAIYDTIPDGPERRDALAIRGGVSIPAVVIYFVASFGLGLVMFSLLGPNLNAVVSLIGM